MSAPVGDPGGLRALAATWASAAEIDTTAMDDLLRAGVSTAAAVQGATGAGSLLTAVTAPGGSLDGAGRLLASASSVLLTYADELEAQQSRWAAAQVTLDQVARSERTLVYPLAPVHGAARITGELDVAQLEADRIAMRDSAQQERTAAVGAADAAAATAAIELSTISAQLELLAARTVIAGASPTPVVGAPSIGQVPAGPGASTLPPLHPMMRPQSAAPAETLQWWQGLTPAEQQALVKGDPDWVGRADGLPAAARDEANRVVLQRDLDHLDTVLAPLGLTRDVLATTDGRAETARRLRQAGWTDQEIGVVLGAAAVGAQLRTAQQEQPDKAVQLYIYEPGAFDGRGRAAISVGDLDSAANVAVLIPGMTSQVPEYLEGHVRDGIALSSSSDEHGLDTAVLSYIGYEAPDVQPAGVFQGMAREGAKVVAEDVAALQASRGDDDPWLTLIGHSYGGVTLSIALADHGVEADAVVLAQVPGAGTASSVADFTGVDPEHVFVLSESDDPVPPLGALIGTLGPDPAGVDFGAIRLYAETDETLFGAHSSMFVGAGWPLRSLTMVAGNRLDQVRTSPRRIRIPAVPFPVTVDPDRYLTPELPGRPVPR